MKPLYSTPVMFKPMKEEPIIEPDGTIKFPWATFFANGLVHTWDNNGVGGENWDSKDYPAENKYLQALARTPYKNPAPYLVGEKCYVPEAWQMVDFGLDEYGHIESAEYVETIPDGPKDWFTICYASDDWHDKDREERGWPWRSPVTMPQWAARRFVTILSCEPVRVSDVTEEDAIKLGFTFDEHNQVMARENFENDWHKRHPGKEWAWRVVSEEII